MPAGHCTGGMAKLTVSVSVPLPGGQSANPSVLLLALLRASTSVHLPSFTAPEPALVTVIVAASAGAALVKTNSISSARANDSAPRRSTVIGRRQRPSGPDIDPPPCGECGARASSRRCRQTSVLGSAPRLARLPAKLRILLSPPL